MKSITKTYLLVLAVIAGLFSLSACHKDHNNTPHLSTTPLYDTLGWFIQGANGPVQGQGAVMISDPDNPGTKIQAGRFAIRTVVNKALGVIAGDEELAEYFPTLLAEVNAGNTTGLAELSKNFTDFVQQAVSHQQVYTGLSMTEAHKFSSNKRFGDADHTTADSLDFDRFVGDIAQAASSLHVPGSVIGQLGALLYTTEGDVVQDHTPKFATTPLYDTLGWFIQGATGPIESQGPKMIGDPDNQGQKIQAGRLAIRTVVNKALGIIASDKSLSVYFPTLLAEKGAGNTTGYAELLKNVTDFVQEGVSGQKVYHGLSMKKAHNHATYSRFGDADHPTADKADFDEFVKDVAEAAQDYHVPNSVIAQLGALLYTTEGDVVQKK